MLPITMGCGKLRTGAIAGNAWLRDAPALMSTSCLLRTITKYVCWKRGKFFGEVNARGTSQECPECGAEVRKDLTVRVHCCCSCGYTTYRDIASGQVIINRGITLQRTDGQSGIFHRLCRRFAGG